MDYCGELESSDWKTDPSDEMSQQRYLAYLNLRRAEKPSASLRKSQPEIVTVRRTRRVLYRYVLDESNENDKQAEISVADKQSKDIGRMVLKRKKLQKNICLEQNVKTETDSDIPRMKRPRKKFSHNFQVEPTLPSEEECKTHLHTKNAISDDALLDLKTEKFEKFLLKKSKVRRESEYCCNSELVGKSGQESEDRRSNNRLMKRLMNESISESCKVSHKKIKKIDGVYSTRKHIETELKCYNNDSPEKVIENKLIKRECKLKGDGKPGFYLPIIKDENNRGRNNQLTLSQTKMKSLYDYSPLSILADEVFNRSIRISNESSNILSMETPRHTSTINDNVETVPKVETIDSTQISAICVGTETTFNNHSSELPNDGQSIEEQQQELFFSEEMGNYSPVPHIEREVEIETSSDIIPTTEKAGQNSYPSFTNGGHMRSDTGSILKSTTYKEQETDGTLRLPKHILYFNDKQKITKDIIKLLEISQEPYVSEERNPVKKENDSEIISFSEPNADNVLSYLQVGIEIEVRDSPEVTTKTERPFNNHALESEHSDENKFEKALGQTKSLDLRIGQRLKGIVGVTDQYNHDNSVRISKHSLEPNEDKQKTEEKTNDYLESIYEQPISKKSLDLTKNSLDPISIEIMIKQNLIRLSCSQSSNHEKLESKDNLAIRKNILESNGKKQQIKEDTMEISLLSLESKVDKYTKVNDKTELRENTLRLDNDDQLMTKENSIIKKQPPQFGVDEHSKHLLEETENNPKLENDDILELGGNRRKRNNNEYTKIRDRIGIVENVDTHIEAKRTSAIREILDPDIDGDQLMKLNNDLRISLESKADEYTLMKDIWEPNGTSVHSDNNEQLTKQDDFITKHSLQSDVDESTVIKDILEPKANSPYSDNYDEQLTKQDDFITKHSLESNVDESTVIKDILEPKENSQHSDNNDDQLTKQDDFITKHFLESNVDESTVIKYILEPKGNSQHSDNNDDQLTKQDDFTTKHSLESNVDEHMEVKAILEIRENTLDQLLIQNDLISAKPSLTSNVHEYTKIYNTLELEGNSVHNDSYDDHVLKYDDFITKHSFEPKVDKHTKKKDASEIKENTLELDNDHDQLIREDDLSTSIKSVEFDVVKSLEFNNVIGLRGKSILSVDNDDKGMKPDGFIAKHSLASEVHEHINKQDTEINKNIQELDNDHDQQMREDDLSTPKKSLQFGGFQSLEFDDILEPTTTTISVQSDDNDEQQTKQDEHIKNKDTLGKTKHYPESDVDECNKIYDTSKISENTVQCDNNNDQCMEQDDSIITQHSLESNVDEHIKTNSLETRENNLELVNDPLQMMQIESLRITSNNDGQTKINDVLKQTRNSVHSDNNDDELTKQVDIIPKHSLEFNVEEHMEENDTLKIKEITCVDGRLNRQNDLRPTKHSLPSNVDACKKIKITMQKGENIVQTDDNDNQTTRQVDLKMNNFSLGFTVDQFIQVEDTLKMRENTPEPNINKSQITGESSGTSVLEELNDDQLMSQDDLAIIEHILGTNDDEYTMILNTLEMRENTSDIIQTTADTMEIIALSSGSSNDECQITTNISKISNHLAESQYDGQHISRDFPRIPKNPEINYVGQKNTVDILKTTKQSGEPCNSTENITKNTKAKYSEESGNCDEVIETDIMEKYEKSHDILVDDQQQIEIDHSLDPETHILEKQITKDSQRTAYALGKLKHFVESGDREECIEIGTKRKSEDLKDIPKPSLLADDQHLIENENQKAVTDIWREMKNSLGPVDSEEPIEIDTMIEDKDLQYIPKYFLQAADEELISNTLSITEHSLERNTGEQEAENDILKIAECSVESGGQQLKKDTPNLRKHSFELDTDVKETLKISEHSIEEQQVIEDTPQSFVEVDCEVLADFVETNDHEQKRRDTYKISENSAKQKEIEIESIMNTLRLTEYSQEPHQDVGQTQKMLDHSLDVYANEGQNESDRSKLCLENDEHRTIKSSRTSEHSVDHKNDQQISKNSLDPNNDDLQETKHSFRISGPTLENTKYETQINTDPLRIPQHSLMPKVHGMQITKGASIILEHSLDLHDDCQNSDNTVETAESKNDSPLTPKNTARMAKHSIKPQTVEKGIIKHTFEIEEDYLKPEDYEWQITKETLEISKQSIEAQNEDQQNEILRMEKNSVEPCFDEWQISEETLEISKQPIIRHILRLPERSLEINNDGYQMRKTVLKIPKHSAKTNNDEQLIRRDTSKITEYSLEPYQDEVQQQIIKKTPQKETDVLLGLKHPLEPRDCEEEKAIDTMKKEKDLQQIIKQSLEANDYNQIEMNSESSIYEQQISDETSEATEHCLELSDYEEQVTNYASQLQNFYSLEQNDEMEEHMVPELHLEVEVEINEGTEIISTLEDSPNPSSDDAASIATPPSCTKQEDISRNSTSEIENLMSSHSRNKRKYKSLRKHLKSCKKYESKDLISSNNEVPSDSPNPSSDELSNATSENTQPFFHEQEDISPESISDIKIQMSAHSGEKRIEKWLEKQLRSCQKSSFEKQENIASQSKPEIENQISAHSRKKRIDKSLEKQLRSRREYQRKDLKSSSNEAEVPSNSPNPSSEEIELSKATSITTQTSFVKQENISPESISDIENQMSPHSRKKRINKSLEKQSRSCRKYQRNDLKFSGNEAQVPSASPNPSSEEIELSNATSITRQTFLAKQENISHKSISEIKTQMCPPAMKKRIDKSLKKQSRPCRKYQRKDLKSSSDEAQIPSDNSKITEPSYSEQENSSRKKLPDIENRMNLCPIIKSLKNLDSSCSRKYPHKAALQQNESFQNLSRDIHKHIQEVESGEPSRIEVVHYKPNNYYLQRKYCIFCSIGVTNEIVLEKHMTLCKLNPDNSGIQPVKIFYCKFCTVGITDEVFLRQHEEKCQNEVVSRPVNSSSVPVTQETDSTVKKKRSTIGRHKCQNEVVSRPVNSSSDPVTQETDSTVKKKRSTNGRHKCPSCEYTTNNVTHMSMHKRTHDKIPLGVCDICHKGFTRLDSLKIHMFRHLDAAKEILEVEKIDVWNGKATKSTLEVNIKNKNFTILKYQCSKCEYSTPVTVSMEKHYNSVHLKITNFKCNLCSFTATEKANLKNHLNWHSREKTYKCSYCSYETINKSYVKHHENQIHLRAITYKCDSCDYLAYRKENLKSHINSIHLKIRKYNCKQCDFFSYVQSNLIGHVKYIHEGIKRKRKPK